MEISKIKLSGYVEGKRAVIVCPSKSLESSGAGSFIEDHDIVVRLNNGYNITRSHENDFGSRTDILYHYLGLKSENQEDYDLTTIRQTGAQLLIIPPRPEQINLEVFLERNAETRLPFYRISSVLQRRLWSELGSLPFCGTWAIYHLLQLPLKSIQVLGMNFFSTGHYRGYDKRSEQAQISYAHNSQFDRRGPEKQHHIPIQKLLISRLASSDERLILDNITKDSIGQL